MHQSPQKLPLRRRERDIESDAFEEPGDRRHQRSAPPRARRVALDEDGPRAQRGGRDARPR
jgi:hypothetical protein